MKILVIYASAGAGHWKAAQALYEGISKSAKDEVVLVDALDRTSPFFKKLYRGSYSLLISRFPWLWGSFFGLADLGWIQPFLRTGRRLFNRLNAGALHRFLQKEKFDCILSTHFFPAEVASALKRKGRIPSRIVTVVTDFDVHKIWLAQGVDVYTVASDWTKGKLKTLGIKARICVCGIPTGEKFRVSQDVGLLKKRLGLKEDLFTVLMATGSFGIGPIEQIVAALEGFQVIVVCGNNRSLFARLSRHKRELVKVMGLVDNMHELMGVCDVLVTKPGGLSISEALVSRLPMVFFHAIPGQERNNIRVLGRYGIGAYPCSVKGIVEELNQLRSSRDAFLTAIRATQQLARPSAVEDIITLIHE